MNQIVKSLAIKVPKSYLIDYPVENIELITKNHKIGYPCIIKPNHEGSSMGVYLIKAENELIDKIILLSQQYEEQLIVEEYVSGSELSIGILGTSTNAKIYCCIQFVYENGEDIEIYDYNCKYNIEHRLIYPRINKDVLKKICDDSLLIHRIMHFQDISRIDWKVNKNGAYLIETTPLPSLEIDSEFDVGCKLMGQSFDIVINEILISALHRWKEKNDDIMGK